MMKFKVLDKKEIQKIKEKHVVRCFTDYLYHKHAIAQLDEKLLEISEALSSCRLSSGIKVIQNTSKTNVSAWQNELFAQEYELIKEQDKHVIEIEQVDKWLATISNKDRHRDIVIAYLINNQCKSAMRVAEMADCSEANVYKICDRLVKQISKHIL